MAPRPPEARPGGRRLLVRHLPQSGSRGLLGWRVAVDADPGAGYVNPGNGDLGPFSRLASQLDLGRLHPRAIIIQGGHDDIGRPLPLIRDRVERLVAEIHREAPHSLLVVLNVFARGNRPSSAAVATDRAIVGAARRADPGVVVVDPLAEHWHFPRIGDHLHPTVAGHRWIARRLASCSGMGWRRRDLSLASRFSDKP